MQERPNTVLDSYQISFCPHHSSKLAFTEKSSDFQAAKFNGQLLLFIWVDLSAVFAMGSHSLCLRNYPYFAFRIPHLSIFRLTHGSFTDSSPSFQTLNDGGSQLLTLSKILLPHLPIFTIFVTSII